MLKAFYLNKPLKVLRVLTRLLFHLEEDLLRGRSLADSESPTPWGWHGEVSTGHWVQAGPLPMKPSGWGLLDGECMHGLSPYGKPPYRPPPPWTHFTLIGRGAVITRPVSVLDGWNPWSIPLPLRIPKTAPPQVTHSLWDVMPEKKQVASRVPGALFSVVQNYSFQHIWIKHLILYTQD